MRLYRYIALISAWNVIALVLLCTSPGMARKKITHYSYKNPPCPGSWYHFQGGAEATELHPAALDAAGIARSRIVQAIGNAKASAGTHWADGGCSSGNPYGLAVDISVRKPSRQYMPLSAIKANVRSLRQHGYAAWFRPWSGNWHIHAIFPGANPINEDKKRQIASFYCGKLGLATDSKDNVVSILKSEKTKVRSTYENSNGSLSEVNCYGGANGCI